MNRITRFYKPAILVMAILGNSQLNAQLFPPDVNYAITSVPSLSRPGYLLPVKDPSFGTSIFRISDSTVFGEANVRHHYSKDPSWNSNQSLILLNGGRFLDGKSYKLIRKVILPTNENRWSYVNPNKLFGTYANFFVTTDLVTGKMTSLHKFKGYTNIYIGPWEGNISIDDKTVAFITSTTGPDADIIIYDISKDSVLATKSISSLGYTGIIDWVSVSQSGKYVVINGRGSSDSSVKSYDLQLNYIATLSAVGEHGDMGYDTDGNEVFVSVGQSEGKMSRLDNGKTTPIFNIDAVTFWGHLSCRNYKRPGWCYVSLTYANDVMAVKLDGSMTVERFTQHRSSFSTYDAEPQAVPCPDGTMVMYASDWNGTAEINSYVAMMGPDTIAPSVPVNLTSSAIEQSEFTISWDASTDNFGVAGYEVFRGPVSCGTTKSNSLVISGLTPSTLYPITVKAFDATGNVSNSSDTLFVSTSVSTGMRKITTNILVYPNPASTVLKVGGIENSFFFSISNLNGTIIMKGKMDNRKEINLSGLPTGFYIINILDGENSVMRKFLKM